MKKSVNLSLLSRFSLTLVYPAIINGFEMVDLVAAVMLGEVGKRRRDLQIQSKSN